MKSKQNKKNNKIETPTPMKTSCNWFVVMTGCGRGVVDATLESVDGVIMDVVELVEIVELIVVDVVGTMALVNLVLNTVDVVGVVVVEEMLGELELEAVIPGFMTVVGETVATGVVLVVELMDVLLEAELEGTNSVSDSLIVLLSSVVEKESEESTVVNSLVVGAFVVVVVAVVLSTAYFVGVGVLESTVETTVVDDIVVDVVEVVVVLTSKPLLMVTLLTANPVVVKFLLMPSIRS